MRILQKVAASVAVCALLVTAGSAADVVKIGVQAPILVSMQMRDRVSITVLDLLLSN